MFDKYPRIALKHAEARYDRLADQATAIQLADQFSRLHPEHAHRMPAELLTMDLSAIITDLHETEREIQYWHALLAGQIKLD